MTTQDPVESLLDRWDAALGADPRADLDSFIGAEGRHLDEAQRAEFRRRAESLARVNRGLDQAVAVSSGPLPGGGSSPSLDAASSEFAAGMEPVPGYTLESRIGKGGFGEVWRARGPGGMPVALKIIARRSDALRMELQSLDHIKGARHPHLLAVTAFWPMGDRLFIASELADGTLLGRWQQVKDERGGIPRDELLQYMHEAAEGIDFLNSPQGERPAMQHGDIKPQNLLLMSGHVKVGDFGLIRTLSSAEAGHHGTMTVQYAAPEFLEGKLSAASDQFSLAGTYCFLRTGKLPFSGNLLQYRDAIRTGRADLGDLPAAEREVVRKALSVAPHERFPSCTAFVAALEAAAGTGPVAPPRRFLVPAAILAACLLAVAGVGIARIRGRQPPQEPAAGVTPTGPLVIPGPRPPGPAEPSLARLEEHHRRWRKTFDDDDARDARWAASPLILSAHAGLRGDHAAEADLLRHYWARFMQATKPSAALAFAREIADLLRTEEKFFAETVDSGNYFSLGDSDSPAALASPLQPHLKWPRFSRLWPFDQSLRLMKYTIDHSTPPMRPMTEAQFRGRMAQRPYDFVEEVLDADDVFETLHPNVNRRKKPQAQAAVETDTLSLLADVVAYCRRIPAPPDQVARDTTELQRDLLRMADTLPQEALTDAAILPVAEKLVPLCEALARDAPRDEDRDTAERARKRFAAIVATTGSGPENANAAETKPVDLLGLPIHARRLLVVWFEEDLPGIQAMSREKLVQRSLADLILTLGPEVEVNLLVAKGPPIPLPDLKPTPWAFDAPVRADKAGRAKLLEALQAADRDAPFPTEPCAAALERAFAAADSIDTTVVFIRLRSPLHLDAASVDDLSQPRQGLVVHGIVAEPSPPIVSLAAAHGGTLVELRLEGDGIFGVVKPTLLDPSSR